MITRLVPARRAAPPIWMVRPRRYPALAAARDSRFGEGHVDIGNLAAGSSGDVAYSIDIERNVGLVDGAARRETALRVTHICQRAGGGWRDRGSLAGDVSLAILSQRASVTAKRDRDPGDPTDMRVPRPERLPRHPYSESRFRPWLHRLSPPLTQRLLLCVRRPAVPPLQKVADNVRPVRPVRMKVHHGLPSFHFTRTTPDVPALEALGPFPA